MKTYVVILNWNGWKDTIECLDSLFMSEGADFVAIVCDNASADSSLNELTTWAELKFSTHQYKKFTQAQVETGISLENGCQLVLIENASNLGFAGGNNVGVRLAMYQISCEYIWLLNNDTIIEPDALFFALERMRQDPNVGLCGSTLIYYHDREQIQAFGGAIYCPFSGNSKLIGAFSSIKLIPESSEWVENKMSCVIGAATLVRKEYINRVGYMQEDYFLYFEEIDWAIRGKAYFKFGYAPKSIVYHKEGASIGTSPSGGSSLSIYYLYKNRIKFTKRFYPIYLPSVFLFCLWDIFKLVVKGKKNQSMAGLNGILNLKY
jgi:GT2 family glycosyltransferase